MPPKSLKRKHDGRVVAAAAPAKTQTVAAVKPRKASAASAAAAAPRPAAFAQPMRRLEDMDDSEESGADDGDDHEAAQDRRHMRELDADNDDDGERAEDDDDEDSDASEQQDDEEAEALAEDDEQQAEDGSAAMEDDAATDAAPAGPIELDLPLQLVQGTYSGVLYGMKTKTSLRAVAKFHDKLHSKRGIEESDVKDEDEDSDAEDDDAEAEEDEAKADAAAAAPAAAASASASASSFGLLFTTAAHIGSLKSLAISADGKWMVSGGIDETIRIFQTSRMREFGQLHQHVGSVSALEFFGSSFMLSGGQEGDLVIWSTKDWQAKKRFENAHQGSAGSVGGVSALAVHPSGRVALSVGVADKQAKLWDLMKGALASQRTVDFAAHTVRWTPSGEKYILVGDRRFEVYDTASKLLRREEVSDTKILAAVFLSERLLALGCEDKSVRVVDITTGEGVATLTGHNARVRGLDAISVAAGFERANRTFLASASTDGQTHLWELSALVDAFADSATSSFAQQAFHPICSSFHDQRVTVLKILPQWAVRGQTELKPVQTAAARQHEAAREEKKAAALAARPGSKAAKAATAGEKAKLLHEKAQRRLENAAAMKAKAARILARNTPHAVSEEETQQQAKKKAKIDFEEAPLVDSDSEEPPSGMGAQSDDEDDENAAMEETAPRAASKKAAAAKGKLAATAAAPAAASKPKKASAAAKAKPAAAAAGGFSASIPLFKPQLHAMQRKKKKSAKKMQRDADRNKQQGR